MSILLRLGAFVYGFLVFAALPALAQPVVGVIPRATQKITIDGKLSGS